MARINLEIDFLTHPKILGIDPLSELLFIRSLLYCARHLTDGFLPGVAVNILTHNFDANSYLTSWTAENARTPDDLVQELVEAGLWHRCKGGYRVHDYLKYQLSRKEVQQLIENKREAGRKGGLAKAKQTPSTPPSKSLAPAKPLLDLCQPSASSKSLAESSPIPIPIPKEKKEKNPLSFSPCAQTGRKLADRTTKGFEKATDPEAQARDTLKRLGITLPGGQA